MNILTVRFYKAVFLLSLPALLWTSFEMYVLTLQGPQMLFFILSHALPILAVIVFVSAIFFILWGITNTVFLLIDRTYKNPALSKYPAGAFLGFQVAHVAALNTYNFWSVIPMLRVIVCITALYFLFRVIRLGISWWQSLTHHSSGTR